MNQVRLMALAWQRSLASLVGALKIQVLSLSSLLSTGSAQEEVSLRTQCSSHPSLLTSEINLPLKTLVIIPQMFCGYLPKTLSSSKPQLFCFAVSPLLPFKKV